MKRLELLLVYIIAFSTAICFLSQPVLGQGDLADEAAAIDEAWDAEQEVLEKITVLGGWYKTKKCLTGDMKDMVDPDKQEFVVEVNMVYNEDETGRQDNENMSADALQFIGKCSQVRKILLSKSQANDEQLAHIADLKHVESVYIWDGNDVTDDGVRHLSGFKKLKTLHLSNSAITDEAIGHLTGLPDIESLSLQGNNFTDKIFEHAAKFEKLNTLWVGIGNSELTDDGLKHLHECKNLKMLGIQQCGISAEAAEALRQKLELETLYHN